jgi:predicted NAD-dependent protein-ADP-ribosyltransferase YbiA (DUF1768 family)
MAVWQLRQDWAIRAHKLAPPPDTLSALLLECAEPVLPKHSPNKTWWGIVKWITGEER